MNFEETFELVEVKLNEVRSENIEEELFAKQVFFYTIEF